jgi:hypothetical protein
MAGEHVSRSVRRFAFRFDPRFRWLLRSVGVTPDTADVTVGPDRLVARFGRWRVATPLENIVSAEVTGPYRWWFKAIGPHLSLADRGITFGTNAQAGVCLRLRTPVAGIDPLGMIRHPGLTVTVDDPAGLAALFGGR